MECIIKNKYCHACGASDKFVNSGTCWKHQDDDSINIIEEKENFINIKSKNPDANRSALRLSDRAVLINNKYIFNCHYCGIKVNPKFITIDHKTPLSKGGKNNHENIVPSCKKCNSEKSDMNYLEYKQLKNNFQFNIEV